MSRPYKRDVGIIYTKGKENTNNGILQLLANEHVDNEPPIEQVYITFCEPGEIKGPHMHTGSKYDRFYCIQGRGVIVCKDTITNEIYEFEVDAFDEQIIVCPPYAAHAIVSKWGVGLLSMTSEGYKHGKPYNQEEVEYTGYNWDKWL